MELPQAIPFTILVPVSNIIAGIWVLLILVAARFLSKPQQADRIAHTGTRAPWLWIPSTIMLIMMALAAIICSCILPKPDEGSLGPPFLKILAVPRTEYALKELDQAVALGAGILTFIYSIYEALISNMLSPWERYWKWKSDCEVLLEEGLLGESETGRWKTELQVMTQMERQILDAPTSTELLAMMERARREHDEEIANAKQRELDNMSNDERMTKQLKYTGIL